MLTWVEINKSNLFHNLAQFKKLAPHSVIWPVVKSNAYGHGLEQVVGLLNKDKNATGFMVVNLAEALEVIKYTDKPVMVLSYFDRGEESLKSAAKHQISLPIYDLASADWLNSRGEKFLINIKIDTGTSRLGFPVEEATEAIKYIKTKKNLVIYSLFTHYAESESSEQSFTKQQLSLLQDISNKFPELKVHSACSAAALSLPESQQDMVRLGIALYGLWPSEDMIIANTNKIELKPVLSWKTKIIQIKKLQAGDSIGYDRTYLCSQDCRIAVLPVGYFEGYGRLNSNQAEVIIKGQRCAVRGNICMNLTMVEVPTDLEVKVGETVTLLGNDDQDKISAGDLARWGQTINYEIVTKINSVLPRLVI